MQNLGGAQQADARPRARHSIAQRPTSFITRLIVSQLCKAHDKGSWGHRTTDVSANRNAHIKCMQLEIASCKRAYSNTTLHAGRKSDFVMPYKVMITCALCTAAAARAWL
jgi:hypothetical protein